jgi:hypothetical protein
MDEFWMSLKITLGIGVGMFICFLFMKLWDCIIDWITKDKGGRNA